MSSCWDNFIDILPIIVVLVLYAYSYYCYMYEMIWKLVKPLAKSIAYGVISNVLLAMTLWSYFATMLTLQDDVPDCYKPSFQVRESIRIASTDEIANDIVLQFCRLQRIMPKTRNSHGFVRYCYYCKHVKPDRSHHCSTCESCILKMDHHCPWVATCIGYSNYKKFVLFLFYTSLYLLFVAATMCEYCYEFVVDPDRDYVLIQLLIAWCLAFTLGVMVTAFLVYHLMLLFTNRTTLEAMTEPTFADNEPLTFDIDPCYNFCEVFGYEVGCWPLPMGEMPSNGCTFHTVRK